MSKQPAQRRADCLFTSPSRYVLLDVIWTMDEKGLIAVARYLINRIPANFARFQMIEDLEFFVQSQLLVQQHQQLFKTAFAHSSLSRVNSSDKQIEYTAGFINIPLFGCHAFPKVLFNRCRS
jgi:hypothetical protein